jgi:hypothetical protein
LRIDSQAAVAAQEFGKFLGRFAMPSGQSAQLIAQGRDGCLALKACEICAGQRIQGGLRRGGSSAAVGAEGERYTQRRKELSEAICSWQGDLPRH